MDVSWPWLAREERNVYALVQEQIIWELIEALFNELPVSFER